MCYILVYTLNIVLKISQHKKSKILSNWSRNTQVALSGLRVYVENNGKYYDVQGKEAELGRTRETCIFGDCE